MSQHGIKLLILNIFFLRSQLSLITKNDSPTNQYRVINAKYIKIVKQAKLILLSEESYILMVENTENNVKNNL